MREGGGLRSAVVVNPSKIDDAAAHRRVVNEALAAAGWPEPVWIETVPDDPGFGQTRQAIDQGAEVVFACGGDGTVMACVGALVGTDVALALLPAGTGNLLAANLGLPEGPVAGVTVATQMGRRRIDVGEVEGRCFAVMAGMGFDAAMVGDASEELKARFGVGAYVWSAVQRLRDHSMRVTIRLDDDPPLRRRARTVLVANVGRLQGGLRLLTDAEPDDGKLDVAIISPRSLRHWVQLTWAVVRRSDRVPRMQVLRARAVEIVSTGVQARQLDGDVIAPARRLDVAIRPAALELCVPQPERSPDMAEGAPA
ncbi:diacylglycerol kinase family protein [soil metagenome]